MSEAISAIGSGQSATWEASSDYARRKAVFEGLAPSGLPVERVETFADAVWIRGLDIILPLIDQLFGTRQRILICVLPKACTNASRSSSRRGLESLGPPAMLLAKGRKVNLAVKKQGLNGAQAREGREIQMMLKLAINYCKMQNTAYARCLEFVGDRS